MSAPNTTRGPVKRYDRSDSGMAEHPRGLYVMDADHFAVVAERDSALARADAAERALQGLLDHYVQLVNCGDCGNWDPEKEPPVIAARAALPRTPEAS